MTDWAAGFLFGLLMCYALSLIIMALIMILMRDPGPNSDDNRDRTKRR